jgi:hypothetical protein
MTSEYGNDAVLVARQTSQEKLPDRLMITYRQGNLLEADVEALVNTVNTVGVMGRGIALMFKERYPDNFRA